MVDVPIRLFISDTDERHIDNIIETVKPCPDILVVGACGNGSHALRQLAMSPADLLITEAQLPGLDGIMLLRDLQRTQSCPACIVCTRFYSSACVEKARCFGATYFLCKPLDYRRLPDVIRDCHAIHLREVHGSAPGRHDAESNLADVIRTTLTEVGVPPKLRGSQYFVEALLEACADPMLLRNLSKGLYVEVAEHTRTTPARLERSMRNAIAVACARGSLTSRLGHCPTNREFLLYMLEQLRLRGIKP